MNVAEQGTREPERSRYQVIPRTLILLTAVNPATGVHEVLLLRGAAQKRLWANKYNGLGGHVEIGEDLYGAAVREVYEETGLTADHLELRGVVIIDTGVDDDGRRPGVLMFVFVGEVERQMHWSTQEGEPEWVPLDQVRNLPLVDDLFEILPRALAGSFFYGHYSPGTDGTLDYRFR